MMQGHIPVLGEEVVAFLQPEPGRHFIDCTFGGGGHTQALLEKTAPDGTVLALDVDPAARSRFERMPKGQRDRIVFIRENFRFLKRIYEQHFPVSISGIIFDLGISSFQLEDRSYGISFQEDAPLRMRLDRDEEKISAYDIVNTWSEEELVRILRVYGQEPRAHALARAIVRKRRQKPIQTTGDLVSVVYSIAFPHRRADSGGRKGKRGIHPATRLFQALRIAVNDELASLAEALPQAVEVLRQNGRIAVISFHSGEDRIAKRFFQERVRAGEGRMITRRPARPSQEEVAQNPRSRSARLRVFEKG